MSGFRSIYVENQLRHSKNLLIDLKFPTAQGFATSESSELRLTNASSLHIFPSELENEV